MTPTQELLQRRRELITQQEITPAPSYIQDGLIFHMDGADADYTNNTWTDKIGGLVFKLHGVSKNNNKPNGVYLGTKNQYASCSSSLYAPATTCTIEVVADAEDTPGAVFSNTNSSGLIGFYFISGYLYHYWGSSGLPKWPVATSGLHTTSVCQSYCYQDLQQYTSNSTSYFLCDSQGLLIGRRDLRSATNAIRNPFTGTIYQIRIYNRKLTAEEIAYNQSIDISKYNIQT